MTESRRGYGVSRRLEMLQYIPSGCTTFLDVGCGAGGFGTALRALRPDATIVGIDSEAVETSEAYDRLVTGSFPSEQLADARFDCVVMNDVLEHMVDPWSALRAAASLIGPSGYVVASIPNIRNLNTLTDLVLKGEFRYTESGVLDRNHVRFFTKSSIAELFEIASFDIARIEAINLPRRGKRAWLRRLTLGRMDDLLAHQFALVASPKSSA